MSTVKISQFQIENVKRVKAVKVELSPSGLTVIGGKNRQGKTSILDAIAWALGGDRYRPSQAQREGSTIPPKMHFKLSNGLIVERRGKNSDLHVTDPSGQKAGQTLLNDFVEQLAIDLPRFLNSSGSDKADTVLRIIGVGDKLAELERKEKELYDSRRAIGQIADQKKKFAAEQPYHPDAPKELVSAAELIQQQQAILAKNGENQRKRERVPELETAITEQQVTVAQRKQTVENLKAQLAAAETSLSEAETKLTELNADLVTARKSAQDLQDESTAELEASIANIEQINNKVRANLDKDKAEDDALEYERRYNALTGQIDAVREEKTDLLTGAELPYPGLSVDDGELTYNGQKWDNMADSEKLIVATSIVRKLNPKCGFVLLDGLERLDIDTLNEFGQWLESEGLQAIATRVGTGEENTLIIEDGYVVGQEGVTFDETDPYEHDIPRDADSFDSFDDEPTPEPEPSAAEASWKAGEF